MTGLELVDFDGTSNSSLSFFKTTLLIRSFLSHSLFILLTPLLLPIMKISWELEHLSALSVSESAVSTSQACLSGLGSRAQES